jgi:hypothetical protein
MSLGPAEFHPANDVRGFPEVARPCPQNTKFLAGRSTFVKEYIEGHEKWVCCMIEKAAATPKDYVPASNEWLTPA